MLQREDAIPYAQGLAIGARRISVMDAECSVLLPSLIVYNTWHKGGTWLGASLFRTLSRTCPRLSAFLAFDSQLEDSQLCEDGGASITQEGAAVVHLNSASHIKLHVPIACVMALPPTRARFIHFVRSPLNMVVSFFLYHITGEECGFADMHVVCNAMRLGVVAQTKRRREKHQITPPMEPALVHALQLAVDKLLLSPLPQMVALHMRASRLPHVLTLRMESFERDFDQTAERLLAFLNVSPSTALHRELLSGFRRHDVHRWETLSARPQHSALARHVVRGRSSVSGVTREAVLAVLVQDASRCRRLSNLSGLLGYEAPDRPIPCL